MDSTTGAPAVVNFFVLLPTLFFHGLLYFIFLFFPSSYSSVTVGMSGVHDDASVLEQRATS